MATLTRRIAVLAWCLSFFVLTGAQENNEPSSLQVSMLVSSTSAYHDHNQLLSIDAATTAAADIMLVILICHKKNTTTTLQIPFITPAFLFVIIFFLSHDIYPQYRERPKGLVRKARELGVKLW